MKTLQTVKKGQPNSRQFGYTANIICPFFIERGERMLLLLLLLIIICCYLNERCLPGAVGVLTYTGGIDFFISRWAPWRMKLTLSPPASRDCTGWQKPWVCSSSAILNRWFEECAIWLRPFREGRAILHPRLGRGCLRDRDDFWWTSQIGMSNALMGIVRS